MCKEIFFLNAKKILHFSIGPMGAAALGVVTLPFVAWFFSVEDVGRLTMLQVVMSLSVSFFSLSMHQAYVREYNEVGDKFALLKMSILPGFLLLLVSSVFFLVLPLSISDILFGIDSGYLMLLLTVGIYSSFFSNFLAHVIRMQGRALAFSAAEIAPKAALFICIGLALLFNLDLNFKLLMFASVVSVLAALIVYAWLTRKTWISSFFKKVDEKVIRLMLAFSLPLVVSGMAYWGLTTMDRFFLRALVGFEELGVYSLAVSLAGAVSVVSSIFSNIWHPIVYEWIKNGVEPRKVQVVIENMLLVVVTIWSLVGLLSWLIPYFLPEEYRDIEYLIVACIAMPLFYMLSETTVVGVNIMRRTSFAMFASILAFITNMVLNYLLIPEYGAGGASLATLFSFFVFFVFRTESSALLWHSFPRVKIYIVLAVYVLATFFMVIDEANNDYYSIVWLILLLLVFAIFGGRVKSSALFLGGYFSKGS